MQNDKSIREKIAQDFIDRADTYGHPLEGILSELDSLEASAENARSTYQRKLAEAYRAGEGVLARGIIGNKVLGVGSGYESRSFPAEPVKVRALLGKGEDEIEVVVNYSGVPKGGALSRLGRALRGRDSGASLTAHVKTRWSDYDLPSFFFDIPSDGKRFEGDGFEQAVSDYLYDVMIHAVQELTGRTDGERESENAASFGWFEGDLVCEMARGMKNNTVIDAYLQRRSQPKITRAVAEIVDQYKERLNFADTEFTSELSDLRERAKKVNQTLDVKLQDVDKEARLYLEGRIQAADASLDAANKRITAYESAQRKAVDRRVLEELNAEREKIENDLVGLREEASRLSARKGSIGEIRPYVDGVLEETFPDYDIMYSDEYDVTPVTRAQVANKITKVASDPTTELTKEEIGDVVRVLGGNIRPSRGKKFHLGEMQEIIDEACWIVGRVGHQDLPLVLDKIQKMGNGKKTDLDTVHSVLKTLV